MDEIIFHITCPDQQGIIAQFTQILFQHKGNILALEQHVEPDEKIFFMRVHTDLREMTISKNTLQDLFNELKQKLNAKIDFYNSSEKLNIAILCTKESVPVTDILMKERSGDIHGNVEILISNHEKLDYLSTQFDKPYHYFPISSDNKTEQEEQIVSLIEDHHIDLIVLARYMQILSPVLVAKFAGKIINIHHGFLPAFKGSRPYHRAWKRGVKIIGATAHYVTEDLDEGQIISQDVVSVSHQFSVKEMIQAGRDIERRVLSYAVKHHCEHRILLHGQRTIIFHA